MSDFSLTLTPAGEGDQPDAVTVAVTHGGEPFADVELEPEAMDWVVDNFGDLATKVLFKYL